MKNAVNLSLFVFSLLFSFAIGELGIRHLGSYDVDGNFTVFHRTLKPYRLPAIATREKVGHLFSPSTILTYDPLLGWTPRPNSRSEGGLYNYNSFGIRSAPFEYLLSPQKNVVRIAIFGDSFTHGDEVLFEHTWGYYLEDNLKKAGVAAEVINFGVMGYGIDQAFLRWKEFGHKFSPDLVIFGLQMENVKRNVNLIRPVYFRRSDLPFSKPRFLLNTDGLELINVPPLPPERLPDVIENVKTWHLMKYEHFLNPEDYEDYIWRRSRFLSLALETFSKELKSRLKTFSKERKPREAKPFFYDLTKEPARLTIKIIQEFKQSVESYNKKFLIVHLPKRSDLLSLLTKKKLMYSELLAQIEENNEVIHPENDMLEEVKKSSLDILFESGGHYSAGGNRVIASVVAKYIATNNEKFSF